MRLSIVLLLILAPVARAETTFIEIPVEGTIGGRFSQHPDAQPYVTREKGEVTAKNIDAALQFAKSNKVDVAVFVIDSGGGYVAEADEILKVMEKYPKIKKVALVRKCISAAIWVAFACDKILMEKGSVMGAAVIFDAGTGQAVSAKFSSIRSAKLSAVATTHGHSPHVVRSMMEYGSELHAAVKDDRALFAAQPFPGSVALDTDRTVLTLTSQVANKYQIADEVPAGRTAAQLPSLKSARRVSRRGHSVVYMRNLHFRVAKYLDDATNISINGKGRSSTELSALFRLKSQRQIKASALTIRRQLLSVAGKLDEVDPELIVRRRGTSTAYLYQRRLKEARDAIAAIERWRSAFERKYMVNVRRLDIDSDKEALEEIWKQSLLEIAPAEAP